MNRDQKAAVIDEIAADITASQAIFAVDYRGITVAQARGAARAPARRPTRSFRVVKNSLTERAADKAGAEELKALLDGPDGADVRARRRGRGGEGGRRLRPHHRSCSRSRAA